MYIPAKDGKLLPVNTHSVYDVTAKVILVTTRLCWSNQQKSVKTDPSLAPVVGVVPTTEIDGKTYEMACLPLDVLHGYLFTINPFLYKGKVVEKINLYRKECCLALRNYFMPTLNQPAKLPRFGASDTEYTAHLIRAAGLLQTEIVAHETTKHRLIETAEVLN